MAGKADIEAGRAYVTLLMKDNGFSKGLAAAGKRMQSVGKGISIVGAAISAAGAAIVTPLVEITREFASASASIVNMSARTHESTDNLLLFQYAAEETGTELEKVQQAIFRAQKEGKNFDKLAERIGAIQDPAQQSKAAIEAFGKKAGPFLVPMLKNLKELRAEFNRLGLAKGMGEGDLKNGKALHKSFLDLGAVIKSVRNVIGAALAPTIKDVVDKITNVVMAVRNWVDQNRELFVTALKIGAVMMGVGAAVTGLGGIIAASGFAIIGINGALGLMASLFGAIISPIGLVVGAVAGLATWFATSTTWGRQMVTSLAGWFGELRDIAVEAFGGIADSLTAGNLALAAQVAMAGLTLVWVKALNEISSLWAGFVTASNHVWSSVERGWANTSEFVGNFWDAMITGIKITLNDLVGWFEKAWSFIRTLSTSEFERIDKATQGASDILRQQGADSIDARTKAAAEARRKSRNLEAATTDVIGSEQEKKAKADLAAAQKQLAELRQQAAVQAKDHELKAGPKFDPANMMTGDMIKSQVFGSYSAAALEGGGGGPPDSATVKELREAKGIWLANLKEMTAIRQWAQRMGLQS